MRKVFEISELRHILSAIICSSSIDLLIGRFNDLLISSINRMQWHLPLIVILRHGQELIGVHTPVCVSTTTKKSVNWILCFILDCIYSHIYLCVVPESFCWSEAWMWLALCITAVKLHWMLDIFESILFCVYYTHESEWMIFFFHLLAASGGCVRLTRMVCRLYAPT